MDTFNSKMWLQFLSAGLAFCTTTLVLFIFLSCGKKHSIFQPQCKSITFDESLFLSGQGDEFDFAKVSIIDDCLHIVIRYGGGCGSIVTSLVDSNEDGNPKLLERNLKLILKDNDPCEASITKKVSFDLKNIQVTGKNEIRLNIMGWPTAILYNY
ncbi:hypothetical protein [Parapedobacter soli]|uniref:hypothetical protein n=1 Tax=Parapedobacter soli TaxID=416955 RepID=UPI0021CA838F|nr:hypothetical protein [Parapedobacter soli]